MRSISTACILSVFSVYFYYGFRYIVCIEECMSSNRWTPSYIKSLYERGLL
jgi:hypothetical protein